MLDWAKIPHDWGTAWDSPKVPRHTLLTEGNTEVPGTTSFKPLLPF